MAEDSLVDINVDQLLKMKQEELDDLYRKCNAGPIPDGEAIGTAIFAPGTIYTKEIAELVSIFAWQGKTFNSKNKTLTNRILPFGLNAIIAEIYYGASWLDDKNCIILDYSKTSTLAHWVRDEIREVHQGFYLGKAYLNKVPAVEFCLDFNKHC